MAKEQMIIIETDEGIEKRIPKSAYIKAKTKQMRDFGYSKLTEEEVLKQVDIILSGEKSTNIIGMFIQDEIKLDVT